VSIRRRGRGEWGEGEQTDISNSIIDFIVCTTDLQSTDSILMWIIVSIGD